MERSDIRCEVERFASKHGLRWSRNWNSTLYIFRNRRGHRMFDIAVAPDTDREVVCRNMNYMYACYLEGNNGATV